MIFCLVSAADAMTGTTLLKLSIPYQFGNTLQHRYGDLDVSERDHDSSSSKANWCPFEMLERLKVEQSKSR